MKKVLSATLIMLSLVFVTSTVQAQSKVSTEKVSGGGTPGWSSTPTDVWNYMQGMSQQQADMFLFIQYNISYNDFYLLSSQAYDSGNYGFFGCPMSGIACQFKIGSTTYYGGDFISGLVKF